MYAMFQRRSKRKRVGYRRKQVTLCTCTTAFIYFGCHARPESSIKNSAFKRYSVEDIRLIIQVTVEKHLEMRCLRNLQLELTKYPYLQCYDL